MCRICERIERGTESMCVSSLREKGDRQGQNCWVSLSYVIISFTGPK